MTLRDNLEGAIQLFLYAFKTEDHDFQIIPGHYSAVINTWYQTLNQSYPKIQSHLSSFRGSPLKCCYISDQLVPITSHIYITSSPWACRAWAVTHHSPWGIGSLCAPQHTIHTDHPQECTSPGCVHPQGVYYITRNACAHFVVLFDVLHKCVQFNPHMSSILYKW